MENAPFGAILYLKATLWFRDLLVAVVSRCSCDRVSLSDNKCLSSFQSVRIEFIR